MGEIWKRQSGESSKAYAIFESYLGLGPDRSLAKLAECGRTAVKLRQLESLCSRFSWVKRAEAWDDYRAELRRRANEEAIVEMSKLHADAARALVEKGLMRLEQLEVERISPDVARSYIVDGIKAERLARGMNTESSTIQAKMEVERNDVIRALENPETNRAIDVLLETIGRAGEAVPGRAGDARLKKQVETC